jgi:hypothetical protein
MSKIVVTVKEPEKMELLKSFLESVDYISSVKNFSSEESTEDIFFYDTFLRLMNVACVCRSDGEFIKPKEIKEKYPNLLEHLKEGSRSNEISFAKNILKFIFDVDGKGKIPKNPKDIREHLSEDGKTLLDYVEKKYISFYSIGHALKKENKTKPWLVTISDIIKFLNDENYKNDKKSDRKLVEKPEFLRFFKDKTEEHRINASK